MNAITRTRIKKEVEMFESSPPPGISCSCVDDKLNKFSAQIMGVAGTPFEGGLFTLDVQIPDRYPFEPPSIRFVTPIYHPNVDSLGRICLDTLKPPPQGSWKPHLNLSAVLMMIRVLMNEPGEEDPLMTDIWQEYKYDYVTYVANAKAWTRRHATTSHTNLRGQTTSKSKVLPDENVDPDPTTSPGRLSGKRPTSKYQEGLRQRVSPSTTHQDDVTEPHEKYSCLESTTSDDNLTIKLTMNKSNQSK